MTRPAATDLITTLSLSLVLESHFVVLFPFAFHIAVQQPFKQLLSRQLLCEHEPYRASFALCFKSLTMSLLSAPEEFVSEFVSPRHLSSSDSYPFDLSGLGDPTGSSATAGLAVRVTGLLSRATTGYYLSTVFVNCCLEQAHQRTFRIFRRRILQVLYLQKRCIPLAREDYS